MPHRPRSLLLRSIDPDPDRTGVLTREVPGARQLVVSSYRLDRDRLPRLLAGDPGVRPAGGGGLALQHHAAGRAAARARREAAGDRGDHLLGGDHRRAASG